MGVSYSITEKGHESTTKFIMAAFSVIAIIFIVISIFAFNNYRTKAGYYEKTEAIITDFRSDGYLVLSYAVGERNYNAYPNFRDSSINYGDRIIIYYDPADPHEIMFTGVRGMLPGIITLVMGVVFGFFGVLLYVFSHS